MSQALENAKKLYMRGIQDGAIQEVLQQYMGEYKSPVPAGSSLPTNAKSRGNAPSEGKYKRRQRKSWYMTGIPPPYRQLFSARRSKL